MSIELETKELIQKYSNLSYPSQTAFFFQNEAYDCILESEILSEEIMEYFIEFDDENLSLERSTKSLYEMVQKTLKEKIISYIHRLILTIENFVRYIIVSFSSKIGRLQTTLFEENRSKLNSLIKKGNAVYFKGYWRKGGKDNLYDDIEKLLSQINDSGRYIINNAQKLILQYHRDKNIYNFQIQIEFLIHMIITKFMFVNKKFFSSFYDNKKIIFSSKRIINTYVYKTDTPLLINMQVSEQYKSMKSFYILERKTLQSMIYLVRDGRRVQKFLRSIIRDITTTTIKRTHRAFFKEVNSVVSIINQFIIKLILSTAQVFFRERTAAYFVLQKLIKYQKGELNARDYPTY